MAFVTINKPKMERIPPHFLGDVPYEYHWGVCSFRGKRVLDLGADVGSTADFFLLNGAVLVTAVEGDEALYNILHENANKIRGIITVHLNIEGKKEMEEILQVLGNTDITKVDIEGAEKYLLDVPNETISTCKEWLVECHSKEIFESLSKKFTECGFNIRVYMESPITFYAKRE